MRKITVIVGPPGAGKTTWALGQMVRGDLLVDVDYLWRALTAGEMYDKPTELLRFVLAAREGVLDELERDNVKAFIISSRPDVDYRQMMRDRFDSDIVVMETPAEECKRRIAEDKRRGGLSDEMAGIIDSWWSEYERDCNDRRITDPAGAVEKITDSAGAVGQITDLAGAVEETMLDNERKRHMTADAEVRAWGVEMEVREVDGDGLPLASPLITGYAAVFGEMSMDLGGFREIIEPGAFAGAQEMDVRALWNHDASRVLGRTRAGTLRLAEDAHGLRVEIDVPDTTTGQDALESIQRGDVDQMSFGFRVPEGGDDWEGRTRRLKRVELFDVSPVTYPAYPQTSVQVRSLVAGLPDDDGRTDDDDRLRARLALARAKFKLIDLEV